MVPRTLLSLIDKNEYLKIISDLYTKNNFQLYLVGGAVRDGNMMRRLAVELNIPFVTTIRGARMETAAIRALIEKDIVPRKLEVHYDSKFL